ncbi:MAG: GTPase HflX [Victivallaceae bacterium]|nr:GTPase HflX [Victivallaceae bacterium]
MIETEKDARKTVERALLVGINDSSRTAEESMLHLDELAELAGNLGIATVGKIIVNLKKPHAKYYVGTGKAEEIAEELKALNADCLIFDDEMYPAQQRNWERLTEILVIDRQEIILDIFVKRATTREATLQVELARLEYYLPRLTKAWSHLSRQGGGGFNKGEGEQQIELDRRLIRNRIAALKSELEVVQTQRDTQRKNRKNNNIPMAAIVGYTNAGKSSLLNKLCDSKVYIANKLFATLDPTTRKYTLPNRQELILTDTVGFVRKLPHALVEAFKSTLEEAVLADFLLLILDISSPVVKEQWETTLEVLKELGADSKRIITVFNKIDLEEDPEHVEWIRGLFPDAVFISAATGEGLNELTQRMESYCSDWNTIIRVKLPPARHDLAAYSHRNGDVLESEYDENGNLFMTVRIDKQGAREFSEYLQTNH